ncbi:type VI secretion system Vgr family protein [Neisseriaceae bacterium ESL0693]|nr:type VI secretion system Vgr family protein [Neisseriaceae bacterium ESL0693]
MQQRYYLKLNPALEQFDQFSVHHFSLTEALDSYYQLELDVTHTDHNIPLDQLIHQPVTFVMYDSEKLNSLSIPGIDPLPQEPCRQWHGVIQTAACLSHSADESRYRLVMVPRMALLDQIACTRLFQHETALTIVDKILRHHGFGGIDFQLQSQRSLPKYEHRMQYRETDWAFIRRVLAQEGLWFRFEQSEANEILVVGDDLSHYNHRDDLQQLPFKTPSGLESTQQPTNAELAAELAFDVSPLSSAAKALISAGRPQAAITDFIVSCQAQYVSVKVKDYNYRDAQNALLAESGFDKPPAATHGTPYLYGQFHHKDPQQAQSYARIIHERSQAMHLQAKGQSRVEQLSPGHIIGFADDAKIGSIRQWLITTVIHQGSRDGDYTNHFEAISADRQWRPEWIPYPVIEGTLAGTVCDASQGEYAWIDEMGRYIVKFNLDLDSWQPGGESRPVRLARPYAGSVYGQHFPLHAGTEVQLAFQNGDPDRPYIVGVLHTSLAVDHVPNSWRTRNVIRTWANNKIRLEDQIGHEHIKIATEYHKSQLGLGHLVDRNRKKRGAGFELRTDGHGAIRSAKGLYLSTEAQPGANGMQLERQTATAEIESAVSQAISLSKITAQHTQKAPALNTLADLSHECSSLESPVILTSAVAGLAQVTPASVLTGAAKDLHQQAGEDIFMGAGKNITQTATESIQLVAQTEDLNLIAGKSTARLASHGTNVELMAAQSISQNAVAGEILLNAKNGIKLASGGSYIEIKDGRISFHSAGPIEYYGNHQFSGPQGGNVPMPEVPSSVCLECLRKARAHSIGVQNR